MNDIERELEQLVIECEKDMIPTEHEEQVQLMTWCRLNAWKYPELKWLAAVPNGGMRNKVTGYRLKQEGVRPGFPDLILLDPRGDYHGMVIELKRRKHSTVSKVQREWLDHLLATGYWCVVAKGWEEARDALVEYLSLEPQ